MVNSVANQPDPQLRPVSKVSSFKIADPQYIISSDPASTVEDMQNTLWQSIGGHEILSVVRRDLVDGSNTDYQLIFDLPELFAQYNPKTIMALQDNSDLYFGEFGIKFEKYVPSQNSLDGVLSGLESPVILDENNNIVIYISNISDNYSVEVQAITSQEVLRDTIYDGTLES